MLTILIFVAYGAAGAGAFVLGTRTVPTPLRVTGAVLNFVFPIGLLILAMFFPFVFAWGSSIFWEVIGWYVFYFGLFITTTIFLCRNPANLALALKTCVTLVVSAIIFGIFALFFQIHSAVGMTREQFSRHFHESGGMNSISEPGYTWMYCSLVHVTAVFRPRSGNYSDLTKPDPLDVVQSISGPVLRQEVTF